MIDREELEWRLASKNIARLS